MEINVSEKLKQLNDEIERETAEKEKRTAQIWEEFTGRPMKQESTVPLQYTATSEKTESPSLEQAVSEEVVTKDDFSSGSKWVMALAGGGGKGSYQLGVWKALREMGLEEHLTAVSGASVGALNAALISLGDYENAENIWFNIIPKQFLDITDSAVTGPLSTFVNRSRSNGICSREGLVDILENKVDLSKLAAPVIDAYACIAWYSSDCVECLDEKPIAEYIRLCEVDKEDAKNVLLASSAMPYIYPPEQIHGKVYRDGGLADNVPIKPLTTLSADKLIVVKLEPDDKIDTSLYASFDEVVEIVPSREIGDLLDGTLDFGSRNVLFRTLLGYYDTLRAFSLRMYHLNGLPLSPAEIQRREEADFQKVMAEVRQERAQNSIRKNMDQLNKIFDQYN